MYRRISVAVLAAALAVTTGCDDEGGGPLADVDPPDVGDGAVGGSDRGPIPDMAPLDAAPDMEGDDDPVCGDGDVEGDEACDDGNTEDGDGCSATCTVEVDRCGDQVLDRGETCDDGNRDPGDGCDAACQTEVIDISAGGTWDGFLVAGEADRYVFDLRLPARALLETSDGAGGCPGDTVFQLYSTDGDTPELLLENDDGGPEQGECSRIVYGLEAGAYELRVTYHRDAVNPEPSLAYQLSAGFSGTCGNDRLELGEECDDGNRAAGDGCDDACQLEQPAVCGDNRVEGDETCDDGNTVPGDGCDAQCQVESVCGDGTQDEGEGCDDGNREPGDGCDADCNVEPFCGDGNVDDGEECDDGGTAPGDGCDAECEIEPECGNGDVEGDEQCDDGNRISFDGCDADCRIEPDPVCGNGRLERGEVCDDGNREPGDGCDADCRAEPDPVCGNRVVERRETCDDGNREGGDGCDANCQLEPDPVCGNGFVEADEQCDDGNLEGGDGCDADCQGEPDPVCGNGILEGDEECDDGNLLVGDGCAPNCTDEPVCGDGEQEGLEACDDGNREPGDGCAPNCTLEPETVCGDGVTEGDEECDDGNRFFGDGCGGDCRFERIPECGNDYLDVNEECDDGNRAPGDGCDADCELEGDPECGNGLLELGEGCDDGGVEPGDGCDAQCRVEPEAVCGNGVVEDGETCDDGGVEPGDGCDAECALEPAVCGDEVVNAGEECDDGGRAPGDGCSADCRFEALPLAPEQTTPRIDLPPGVVHVYTLELQYRRRVAFETRRDDALACAPDVYRLRVVDALDREVHAADGQPGDAGCVRTELELDAGSYQVEVRADAAAGPYALWMAFRDLCGNGVRETGESCDDGARVPGDGCDALCQREDVVIEQPGDYAGGWAAGGEDIFIIELPVTTLVSLQTGDGEGGCPGDTRMILSRVLDGNALQQLTLDDDRGVDQCSRIVLRLQPGTYHLRIDGPDGAALPAYTLAVEFDGTCGNNIFEWGEQCDDGDLQDGDGCDAECRLPYTDVGPGGLFGAGAPAGVYNLFGFDLDVPAEVTVFTGDTAVVGPDGPPSCIGIDTVVELLAVGPLGFTPVAADDDGGFAPTCSRVEAELPAGSYRVRVSHPAGGALPEYRIWFGLGDDD